VLCDAVHSERWSVLQLQRQPSWKQRLGMLPPQRTVTVGQLPRTPGYACEILKKKGFTNNNNNNMELYYGLLLPYCQTEWGGPSPPGSISVPTSTYHLVVCLLETGSVVLVDQTTDGSIRFVTTPATCPRRCGDQPFFVAMTQEWRNGPRWLREHDDDDDILRTGWLPNKQITN